MIVPSSGLFHIIPRLPGLTPWALLYRPFRAFSHYSTSPRAHALGFAIPPLRGSFILFYVSQGSRPGLCYSAPAGLDLSSVPVSEPRPSGLDLSSVPVSEPRTSGLDSSSVPVSEPQTSMVQDRMMETSSQNRLQCPSICCELRRQDTR